MGYNSTVGLTTWRYVENNMMKETGRDSGNDLWRTSLAYIAYPGNEELLAGIKSCFEEYIVDNKSYIQGHRYPCGGAEDFSRDQLTAAITALYLNMDLIHVKSIVDNIRWKISEKFSLTLDMWFWLKSLANYSKFYSVLFHLSSIFIMLPSLLWNKHKKRWVFPKYAYHLFCWQLFTSPSTILKPLLVKIARIGLERDNLLLRILLNGWFAGDPVENYKPRIGWAWQDATVNRELNVFEADYNAIDKDILKSSLLCGKY